MIKIEIDSDAKSKLLDAITRLQDARPLFHDIAGALESETEANFAAGGRPHWVPLSKATKRSKGGKSVLQVLQDSGTLAKSIQSNSSFGADFAQIGSNLKYAAIHQFGGVIDVPARQTTVRLRTTAKGALKRQGKDGNLKNLAVFAKQEGPNAHKRYVEKTASVDAYRVKIPARPYLPFAGSGDSASLQPEARQTIMERLERWLAGAFE